MSTSSPIPQDLFLFSPFPYLHFPSLISRKLGSSILHTYLIRFPKCHLSVAIILYHMTPSRALALTLGLLPPLDYVQGPVSPLKGSDTFTSYPPGKYPSHSVWALKTCARPPHFRDIVSVCLSSDTILCASVPLFSEFGLSLTLLRLIPWSRPLQFPYSAHMCPARPH